MKTKLFFWQFAGVTFTSILGTILHFLYSWTNNSFIAIFSSVNESTWEHMKLLFFPMLIFVIIEYFFIGKIYNNFWLIKLEGILLGLILIPTLFYTIGGIFGKTPDFINILIFFVAIIISYFFEYNQLLKNKSKNKALNILSIIILSLIAIFFGVFTFFPPKIPLFLDPLSSTYGI